MAIETKRIYKITRDKFHGIFQLTKEGYNGDYYSSPIAVIEYENELREVEPYQVEFTEEEQ